MNHRAALLISRQQVAQLLTTSECVAAVEYAFRMLGEGKADSPAVLGVHAENGSFHIKAGILRVEHEYFAAKINANFPENPTRCGLPTIQGVIVLSSADDGSVLAILDSMEITARRTAAATAVAAKHLARDDSKVLTICGCGHQGRAHLRALAEQYRLEQVCGYDRHPDAAHRFSDEMTQEMGLRVQATTELGVAVRCSDICVTCTPSRKPLFTAEEVNPGTFIAAIGADNPEKQELHPALMAKSKVVVDLLDQCAAIGDLHHAIASGRMSKGDVYAELGELVAGIKPGRISKGEITIFDSTGIGLQDVSVAVLTYQQAVSTGAGVHFDLAV